jgi:hypothetical protein
MEGDKMEKKNKKGKILLITILVAIAVLMLLMNIIVLDKVTGKTIMQSLLENFTSSNKNVDPQCGTPDEPRTIPSHVDINYVDEKPIIYLYPTQETEVKVELEKAENLLYTYPKYKESWEVTAKSNGDLVDKETGRNLYALYWEGKNTKQYNEKSLREGFCVKGEDTIEFLEEKLEILGLTQREANEFIIYWLPQMESNKYNYIRFQTKEEIDENMPLTINPNPDTIIRVMMEFKALPFKIDIKEQQLEKVTREGFTVVEWGGSEL